MARTIQNPLEKLMTLSSQLDNVIKSIFENAGKPEFQSSLLELKAKLDNSESSEMSKDASEIVKLLQQYDGLSKPTLQFLRSKIAEYKDLGVLENYKTAIQTSQSQEVPEENESDVANKKTPASKGK